MCQQLSLVHLAQNNCNKLSKLFNSKNWSPQKYKNVLMIFLVLHQLEKETWKHLNSKNQEEQNFFNDHKENWSFIKDFILIQIIQVFCWIFLISIIWKDQIHMESSGDKSLRQECKNNGTSMKKKVFSL